MTARDLSTAPIEPLESRIAPSVIIAAGGRSAHYTDVDGDIVTITVSKGKLSSSDFLTMSNSSSVPNGEQLLMINFADDRGEFNHANLTITAKPGRYGGDGHADIGSIDAGDGRTDLGKVSIDGDLGGIIAGDANISAKSPGVKLLIAEAFTGYSGSVAGGIAKIKLAGDKTSGSSTGGSNITTGSNIQVGSSSPGSSGSVVTTGMGTATLGAGTFVGGTTGASHSIAVVSGGTLSLSNPTTVYAGSNSFLTNGVTTTNIVRSYNSLDVSPLVPTTATLGGSFILSGSTTSSPTIPLGTSGVVLTALTINNGTIGSSGLVKTGSGVLQLAPNNTYTGTTTLAAGSLVVTNNTGLSYFSATNTGSTALQFADVKNVEVKVGDDIIKVASDSTLTFTADDGSTESSPGGALGIKGTSDGTRATVTLTSLDPATTAPTATAFDVMVNDATVNIVQSHALFDKLIANGWTVSETGTQTGTGAVTIKLTSPGAVKPVLPVQTTTTV